MSTMLLAAMTNLVVLAAIFVPLERAFPARPWQRVVRPALVVDGCFFLGGYLVTNAIALTLLHAIDHAARGRLHVATIAWPAAAQVVLAVVLGDLVVYFFHRACHRFEWLWRFHAVHHSSEHLDWVAAHREHPFDGVATQICMNFPAIVLGVPVELLAGLAVFRGMWAIFVHSNVRLPLGPLKWIFGAPELHHWHHAKVERTTHNFANLAPYLDWIFGTHHEPIGEERYALGIDEPLGSNWLALVLSPFRKRARVEAIALSSSCDTPSTRARREGDGAHRKGRRAKGKPHKTFSPSALPVDLVLRRYENADVTDE